MDFAHLNFRDKWGRTRLRYLWDQRGGPQPESPEPFGYGREFSRDQINSALLRPDPYEALDYDPSDADSSGSGSHGTHVADIAAGNGAAPGSAPGVAPESDILFVHLKGNDTRPEDNLGDSARLLEAVSYIVDRAAGRPVVINLSLGTHGGPHDGSNLVEQAFDALLEASPGCAIVISTGNYFGADIHSSGRIRAGEQVDLQWHVAPRNEEIAEMEVWYDGSDVFEVELIDPLGRSSAWVSLGRESVARQGDRIIASIYHRLHDPNNGDNQINVFLWPDAMAGTWTTRLTALSAGDGTYHAWIERDDPAFQSRFAPECARQTSTTGSVCNGRKTITVGAYDARDVSHPLVPFSSSGRTRDGRQKPDVSAPGAGIWAARSSNRRLEYKRNDGVTLKTGASMAAPHVTGIIALMFETAGELRLTADETREILINTCRRGPPYDDEMDRLRYGAGRVDAAAAVKAVFELKSSRLPPPVDVEVATKIIREIVDGGRLRKRSQSDMSGRRREQSGEAALRWLIGAGNGIAKYSEQEFDNEDVSLRLVGQKSPDRNMALQTVAPNQSFDLIEELKSLISLLEQEIPVSARPARNSCAPDQADRQFSRPSPFGERSFYPTPLREKEEAPDKELDPIHDPLIKRYRQEHGLPAKGIDPVTGDHVGPTDREIKYGVDFRRWSDAGLERDPSLVRALRLLGRYSPYVRVEDIQFQLLPKGQRSWRFPERARSHWDGDRPVIELAQGDLDSIHRHINGISTPSPSEVAEMHAVIRTIGHEMRHLWRGKKGHSGNPIQPVWEAESNRLMQQVRQEWLQWLQSGGAGARRELGIPVSLTINKWEDIPQSVRDRIETEAYHTDAIEGLYLGSAYLVEEIYTKIEELSFLQIQQASDIAYVSEASRLEMAQVANLICVLNNMLDTNAKSGRTFVTPALLTKAKSDMMDYLRKRYSDPGKPSPDSFEVRFYQWAIEHNHGCRPVSRTETELAEAKEARSSGLSVDDSDEWKDKIPSENRGEFEYGAAAAAAINNVRSINKAGVRQIEQEYDGDTDKDDQWPEVSVYHGILRITRFLTIYSLPENSDIVEEAIKLFRERVGEFVYRVKYKRKRFDYAINFHLHPSSEISLTDDQGMRDIYKSKWAEALDRNTIPPSREVILGKVGGNYVRNTDPHGVILTVLNDSEISGQALKTRNGKDILGQTRGGYEIILRKSMLDNKAVTLHELIHALTPFAGEDAGHVESTIMDPLIEYSGAGKINVTWSSGSSIDPSNYLSRFTEENMALVGGAVGLGKYRDRPTINPRVPIRHHGNLTGLNETEQENYQKNEFLKGAFRKVK
jgi:subtilisin family serine protease